MPTLPIFAFDAERYTDALQRAGHSSSMIPLLAVPQRDGEASGKHIEGRSEGPDSVAETTPRLQALLAR